MHSFNNHARGFATLIVVGGVVAAVTVGGILYFLRGTDVTVDTVKKTDEGEVIADTQDLEGVAEQILLSGLARGEYYSILGLTGDAGLDEIDAACNALFVACAADEETDDAVLRSRAEACLVLRNPRGRAMYNEWLDRTDAGAEFFPLYYAIFGLEPGRFSQKELADAYTSSVTAHTTTSPCDNSAILRLLAEGYLVLLRPAARADYDAWVAGKAGDAFAVDIGTLINDLNLPPAVISAIITNLALSPPAVSAIISKLTLSSATLGEVLGGLNLSAADLGAVLAGLNLSASDLSGVLGGLNLSAADLSSVLDMLSIPPASLGEVLGGLNLSAAELGAVLAGLNLSIADLSGVFGDLKLSFTTAELAGTLEGLDLSAAELGAVLAGLNLSIADLSGVFSDLKLSFTTAELAGTLEGLDLSTADLGAVLGGLDLPLSDLGEVIGNLNLSASDLNALLGDLDLSSSNLNAVIAGINATSATTALTVSDITAVLTNAGISASDLNAVLDTSGLLGSDAGLSTSDISGILNNFNFSASDLSGILGSFNLSSSNLGAVIGGLDLSSPDLTSLFTAYDIPPFLFSGIRSPSDGSGSGDGDDSDDDGSDDDDDTSDLPIVFIRAVRPWQIGAALDTSITPTFQLTARKDGNLYTPPSALAVALDCTATADSGRSDSLVAASALPTQHSFSASDDLITVQRNPGVIGSVSCTVADDTDGDDYIADDTPATVTIVSGSSPPLCGQPPCDTPPSGSLPSLSLRAAATPVAVGGDAVFVVTADRGVARRLRVRYQCSGTPLRIVRDAVNLSDKQELIISAGGGLQGERIVIPTADGLLGTVTCSLLRDDSVYTVDNRTAAVEIGTVGGGDPTLPTVSLISHFVSFDSQQYESMEFIERSSEVFEGGGIFFSFVIQDLAGQSAVQPPAPDALQVSVQCFRDFLDPERAREVTGTLFGGRYRALGESAYRNALGGYDTYRAAGDPDGNLYIFMDPFGSYFNSAAGVYMGAGLPSPTTDGAGTLACEIIGGAGSAFNVGIRRASVTIPTQPIISIEADGGRGIGDADPVGAPVATVYYGEKEYTADMFKEGGEYFEYVKNNQKYKSDPDDETGLDKAWDVGKKLAVSYGVGFLTSFGSCVAADKLNSALGSLGSRGAEEAYDKAVDAAIALGDPLPKRKVEVEDKTLQTKECAWDSAAKAAAMEMLTSITRDYITWASEGFNNQPLFYQNPTTFYKNFRDNVIGQAIDRSGLGFLCDIGVADVGLQASIKIELEQKYGGIIVPRARCTYANLSKNLEKFAEDIHPFAIGENLSYLFEAEITADTLFTGNRIIPSPRSDAGDQLDALSRTLDDTMHKARNTKNLLLALSDVDAEIDKKKQEVDFVAKPEGQMFNPNDPTSVSAFTECSEEENPEGDADCLLLKVHGSRISGMLTKALDSQIDSLVAIDEFGEIGQLVKLSIEATSAGLMKRFLKDGLGHRVMRETANILSDIEASVGAPPYGSRDIGLGGMWWSAFFQGNDFYSDLLSAEIYARDAATILQYINRSFYDYPGLSVDKVPIPPTAPYTTFATTMGSEKGQNYPIDAYQEYKDLSVFDVRSHYSAVYDSGKVAEEFLDENYAALGDGGEGALERFLEVYALVRTGGLAYFWQSKDAWVKDRMATVFDAWIGGESDERVGYRIYTALRRFNALYPFLTNYTNRLRYNTFTETLGDSVALVDKDLNVVDDGNFVEFPYVQHGGHADRMSWVKRIVGLPSLSSGTTLSLPYGLSKLSEYPGVDENTDKDLFLDGTDEFFYPKNYSDLKKGLLGPHFQSGVVCDSEEECKKACSVSAKQRAQPGTEAVCTIAMDVLPCNYSKATSPQGCLYNETYNDRAGRKRTRSVSCAKKIESDDRFAFSASSGGGGAACVFVQEKYFCLNPLAESADSCQFNKKVLNSRTSSRASARYTTRKVTCSEGDISFGYGDSGEPNKQPVLQHYCPAGKYSGRAAEVYEDFANIRAMREIYEATILAHIQLVGLVADYEEGHKQVDSIIHDYRSAILSDKGYSGAFEWWKLVRDETFKKFRDGTMAVYVPIDNDNAIDERHKNLLGGCETTNREVVTARFSSFAHRYQETSCFLGTVFQDQAFFVIRRKEFAPSELSDKPLTVELACGYADAGNDSSLEEHLRFAKTRGNPVIHPVPLSANQDAVLFPVPEPSSYFDSSVDADRNLRENEIRCSIVKGTYASGGGDAVIDQDMLTAAIEVSNYRGGDNTFHSKLSEVLKGVGAATSINNRIEKIGAALFHLYVWGWYTGFIEMPYFSIQDLLLSGQPFLVPSDDGPDLQQITAYTGENQETLHRYQLLASLYVDESSDLFDTEHFGFLTPDEARKKYRNYYEDRSKAYFGRVLGNFLRKVPDAYRQQ